MKKLAAYTTRLRHGLRSRWAILSTKLAAVSVFTFFLAVTTLFFLAEWSPNYLSRAKPLHNIRYFKLQNKWVPDSNLIFTPRTKAANSEYVFNGDLYDPAYGIEPAGISYRVSFNELGFRTNSSSAPFDLVFLGDSYLQIGETDDLTLSEIVCQQSGLSTFNLGRAGYGPCQYLKILEKYGRDLNAKVTLMCFFAGNDLHDTDMYIAWEKGDAGWFVVNRSLIERYFIATNDILRHITGLIITPVKDLLRPLKRAIIPPPANAPPLDKRQYVGLAQTGDHLVPMRFCYWDQHDNLKQLRKRSSWNRFADTVTQLQQLIQDNGSQMLAVYIPTKIQVYGGLCTKESGSVILRNIDTQLKREKHMSVAFEQLMTDKGIPCINLLPVFKEQAKSGAVLYYPTDTHWNRLGREVAAKLVAEKIRYLISQNQLTSRQIKAR